MPLQFRAGRDRKSCVTIYVWGDVVRGVALRGRDEDAMEEPLGVVVRERESGRALCRWKVSMAR